MKNRIITISREFGSGGRTIGRQAAARLGIPCYDQELIEKVAQESGFAEEYVCEQGEYAQHGGWFANALSGRLPQGISVQDYIWTVQKRVILDLADKGPCVIVGRCADYILRDVADCLRVFVHADMEKRAERIVRLYGETAEAPQKRLKDKDKRRAAYYRFYTDEEWGNVRGCHIALDSGALGIDVCTDILVSLF